jgi:hypothetical protein
MKPTRFTGAFCATCKVVFDECSSSPWSWQNSQALHERGTGHKMKRFNIREIDALKLAYDGVLQKL